MSDDALEMARRSAEAMWADDRASTALGMQITHIGPGEADITMTIRETMTNGHGMCHGGYIFTLADSAFAFACNSYRQRHVASQCQISFLAPAQLGQTLTAKARERYRAERSGIYDVVVTSADGTVIAEFRGHNRSVPGSLY